MPPQADSGNGSEEGQDVVEEIMQLEIRPSASSHPGQRKNSGGNAPARIGSKSRPLAYPKSVLRLKTKSTENANPTDGDLHEAPDNDDGGDLSTGTADWDTVSYADACGPDPGSDDNLAFSRHGVKARKILKKLDLALDRIISASTGHEGLPDSVQRALKDSRKCDAEMDRPLRVGLYGLTGAGLCLFRFLRLARIY